MAAPAFAELTQRFPLLSPRNNWIQYTNEDMRFGFIGIVCSTFLAATFAGALGSLQLTVHAQNVPTDPAFDVVSIRRNREGGGTSSFRFLPDGSFTVQNFMPAVLLTMAFPDVSPYQFVNIPEWALTESFDLSTKGDQSVPKPTPPQRASMLQKMFVERFGLQTHRDSREQPVLILRSDSINARDRRKLTAVATDCERIRAAAVESARDEGLLVPRMPETGPVPACFARVSVNGFEGDATIDELAAYLRVLLREDVINGTSLKGYYRFALTVSRDGTARRGGTQTIATLPAESIGTALREQTGLRLEAGRASVSVLVIDRFLRPTPN